MYCKLGMSNPCDISQGLRSLQVRFPSGAQKLLLLYVIDWACSVGIEGYCDQYLANIVTNILANILANIVTNIVTNIVVDIVANIVHNILLSGVPDQTSLVNKLFIIMEKCSVLVFKK